MWTLLSPTIKGYVWVCSTTVVAAIYSSLRFGSLFPEVFATVGVVFGAVGTVATLGVMLGRQKWVWKISCWAKVSKFLYPDISGEWEGAVLSHAGNPDGALVKTPITVKITQTWTSIGFEVDSPRELIIRTLRTVPEKREGEPPVLWVNFEAVPLNYTDTDPGMFQGTDCLTYDSKRDRLTGLFWTNRAWPQNRQTAGKITLERKKQAEAD